MRFPFDTSDLLPDKITVLSGASLPINKFDKRFYQYATIIDSLGCSSGKAQFLNGPVTSYPKLIGNPDQRLYVLKEDSLPPADCIRSENIIGMLKVGPKSLFLQDEKDRILQVFPLCVLDFYIDEFYQRQGYGKFLFEYFLKMEGKLPQELAYDRPSPKLAAFLQKHYNLSKYIPQNNNFVVFHEFGLHLLPGNSSAMSPSNDSTANNRQNIKSLTNEKELSYDLSEAKDITIPCHQKPSERPRITITGNSKPVHAAGIKSDRDRIKLDGLNYGYFNNRW